MYSYATVEIQNLKYKKAQSEQSNPTLEIDGTENIPDHNKHTGTQLRDISDSTSLKKLERPITKSPLVNK